MEFLPTGARDNLEQFVDFFPQVAAKTEEHDTSQRLLEERCREYFTAIVEHPDFIKAFDSVASEAPQALEKAYSSKVDQMGVLAEYMINNVETLPNYYSTEELWNHYRDRFVKVLLAPEITSRRELTEQAGSSMLDAVDQVTALLKATRSELSLQFDLPIVGELSSVR